MISLRKLSIVAIIAIFSFGLASCSKKDEQLATDYATKKASAQTLIDQINQNMATMHTDHDQWSALLITSWQRPGADTTSIGVLKGVAGVSFTFFDARDVVRHPLVQRIVQAYEAQDDAL